MSVNLSEVLPSYLWSDILRNLKLEELTGLTKVNFILRDIILSDVKLNRILAEEESIRVRAQQSLKLWQKFNITNTGFGQDLTLEFIENNIKKNGGYYWIFSYAPIGIEIFKAPQLGDDSLIPTALRDIWPYDKEVPDLFQFKFVKDEDSRIVKYDNKYISLTRMLKGYVPSDEYHARVLQYFGLLKGDHFEDLPEIKYMKHSGTDPIYKFALRELLYEVFNDDLDLYQKIIDVYKEDGYEFYYYGFFKSDYPGLLARKPVEEGGWELTPEKFEKYNSTRSINKDEEIYNYIISDKYNTSNARRELVRISRDVPCRLRANLLGWSSRKVAEAILFRMKQSPINYRADEYAEMDDLTQKLKYLPPSLSKLTSVNVLQSIVKDISKRVNVLQSIINDISKSPTKTFLTTEYLNFPVVKRLIGIVASNVYSEFSGLRVYEKFFTPLYVNFVYRHMFQTWNYVDWSIYCQFRPFEHSKLLNLDLLNLEDARFTINTIGRPFFDLRHLAKNILDLDINGLSFNQICQIIEQKLS